VPDAAAILADLRKKATEQTRRTYLRHGIPAERMFSSTPGPGRAAGLAMISENTLARVTVESPWARELAMKWIGSKQEHVASSGWATCAGFVIAAGTYVRPLLARAKAEGARRAGRKRDTIRC
jgi:hypothetical protein